MNKYNVKITYETHFEVEVMARNEEEAERQVKNATGNETMGQILDNLQLVDIEVEKLK